MKTSFIANDKRINSQSHKIIDLFELWFTLAFLYWNAAECSVHTLNTSIYIIQIFNIPFSNYMQNEKKSSITTKRLVNLLDKLVSINL